MSKFIKTEFTPYPPWGFFYYRLFNKSPLGDLGVKIFNVCLTLILLEFICTGKAFSQDQGTLSRTIKIGLLIKDSTYISGMQGAELAVRNANEKGGMNGSNFKLVVRSMEGPWGTGSKQAVNLIFQENVWALLGSHDGRNAHLVEQAATRTIVVLVSAWTGDPTLSQAFVPWFYNCVPNDRQQAIAITEEIFNKQKVKKVAVIYDSDYDSKQVLNSFLDETKLKTKAEPVQFFYDDYSQNIKNLLEKVKEADSECIILFCRPSVSSEIFRQIRLGKIKYPVYGSLFIVNEDELSEEELEYFDNDLLIPSGNWTVSSGSAFIRQYRERYGKRPGMVAAYAFDGMNLIIEAIKIAGSDDREKIQKALSEINYKGVTGTIQFDEKGNRSGKVEIKQIKKGIPAAIGTF
jgi:branched-chain amino acid transport system substrate-binding protein